MSYSECQTWSPKRSEAGGDLMLASLSHDITPRQFSNRVLLCQASLSIGLYLLLKGTVPTIALYPLTQRVNLTKGRTPEGLQLVLVCGATLASCFPEQAKRRLLLIATTLQQLVQSESVRSHHHPESND